MSKPRLYLLVVFSPALQKEHEAIFQAVEYHSDGDFTEVFKQTTAVPGAKASGADIPFTVAYLFSTTKPPREMGFGLTDRDRYLLIEVSTTHWAAGLSVAKQWLDRH